MGDLPEPTYAAGMSDTKVNKCLMYFYSDDMLFINSYWLMQVGLQVMTYKITSLKLSRGQVDEL